MNMSRHNHPAEPFFLTAGSGNRFCLYHAPPPDREHHGSFIYVHPFAEEINKSRRMAAMQARAFASAGYGVLQIDLFGCGDSSGEFGEARWEIWKDDLSIAKKWLDDRARGPVSLWGLRLGALLALDFAMDATNSIEQLVLWQPVISGESYLTQFLRTRLASEMLGGGDEKAAGTKGMREALTAGETLEIAGYALAPALAASIDAINVTRLALPNTSVHWFELVSKPGSSMPPASARAINTWTQQGVDVRVHLVPGTAFWASQEITECPPLLAATTSLAHEVMS
jgi:exosortase A-associated hydrolase 2